MSQRWTTQEIRVVARRVASKMKRPDIVDDLVQEVLLANIVKPDGQTNLHSAVIDAVRRVLGDNRTKQWEVKYHAEWFYSALDDQIPYLDTIEEKIQAIDRLEEITPLMRMILWAFWIWGFQFKEIGEALGISEGRVSQIVGKMGPRRAKWK